MFKIDKFWFINVWNSRKKTSEITNVFSKGRQQRNINETKFINYVMNIKPTRTMINKLINKCDNKNIPLHI